jgi:hypothetical protein
MEVKYRWRRLFLFLFFSGLFLGVFTWITRCYPIGIVTGYIFVVGGLVAYVQQAYNTPLHKVDIGKLELAPPGSSALRLEEIMLREFDYVKDTASQAMNDRHTMVNYFLLSAGVVVTGIGVLLSKEGAADFEYRDQTLVALSLLFCTVGWVYFMQLVRLRQAWCDSARAMNHLKRVFVQGSGHTPEMAERIFLWSINTIPRANKPLTVFHLSALLISILSAVAIGLATLILLNKNGIRNFWVAPIALGLYHLFFQMRKYHTLLQDTSAPPKTSAVSEPVVVPPSQKSEPTNETDTQS